MLVVADPGLRELGRTINARRLSIWTKIVEFYQSPAERGNPNDRLKSLPEARFRPKGALPVLKGSAGQIRRLVPFFAQLVASWGPQTHSAEHCLVKKAMLHLHECYKCLSSKSGLSPTYLRDQAAAYGQCLQELHQQHPTKYALKAKLHQFQELCSSGHRPASTWNYRDEDFGGCLSRMCKVEGGRRSANAISTTCLSRFCLKQPVPSLLSCKKRPSSSNSE